MFTKVIGLALLVFQIGQAQAAPSQSSNSVRGSLPSSGSVGCQGPFSCPECGGYTCVKSAGYCRDNFTNFPGSPFQNNKLPIDKVFDDPTTCTSNGTSCNGGQTTCKLNRIPVDPDDYLTYTPGESVQKYNTVTCRYYDPSCQSCCVAYTNNCHGYSQCPVFDAQGHQTGSQPCCQ